MPPAGALPRAGQAGVNGTGSLHDRSGPGRRSSTASMFGPEAVSPDPDLYRAHPDWALHIPGRETLAIRNQYVLDFSREEVRENIWQQLTALLDACPLPAPARATPCRRCTPAARTKRPTPARPWPPPACRCPLCAARCRATSPGCTRRGEPTRRGGPKAPAPSFPALKATRRLPEMSGRRRVLRR